MGASEHDIPGDECARCKVLLFSEEFASFILILEVEASDRIQGIVLPPQRLFPSIYLPQETLVGGVGFMGGAGLS